MLTRLRTGFEQLLELIVIVLMITIALEVIIGVTYRRLGLSLSWYDEIASITLAWLTYYGAALAALKRAHIGCPNLISVLPPRWRIPLVLIGEVCVFAFFILLAWTGFQVMEVLATDTLISLPSVPTSVTQSVIPISAILFIIAEALGLPQAISDAGQCTPRPETLEAE